jgi:predicted GNAT family acetyltransferase
MRLTVLEDPGEFTDRVQRFLLTNETVHNLLLSVLADLSRGSAFGVASPVLSCVEDETGVRVVGVMTPPRNLLVSRSDAEGAVGALAGGLCSQGLDVPGVLGPSTESGTFAAVWARLTMQPFRQAMAMHVYRATRIRMPDPMAPGTHRPASPGDVALLAGWITAFNEEALEEGVSDPSAATRAAEDLMANPGRSLSLWEVGGVPVSMAATGGSTPNGSRVYAVYTPPEHRRRGYASALVAVLSRRLLAGGLRYCFLFTDRANPTSNHIYRQIGYEPVAPFDSYRFGV